MNMKRKLFCEISPLTYAISRRKCIIERSVKNLLSVNKLAKTKQPGKLPYVIYCHNSLIRRKLGNVESRFDGHIISLYVKNCLDTGAIVEYLPSRSNMYHSEIHGSPTNLLLSKSQRRFLARKAVIVK